MTKSKKSRHSTKLNRNVFRTQFFTFATVGSMISLQFELLMGDRGIPLAWALVILSVSQSINMLTMLTLRKLDDVIKDMNIVIRTAFVIRAVITGAMVITTHSGLFIALFLMFHVVAAPNVMFEGMVTKWSFERGLNFSNIRYFASICFSTGGLIAGFIFSLTGNINSILIYIFIISLINAVGAFIFPVEPSEKDTAVREKRPGLKWEYRLLLILVAMTMSFPGSFGFVLNAHYRDVFGLSVDSAIFFAGVALLIGAFLSEVTGFIVVDRLVTRFGTKRIMLMGFVMSVTRWVLAFIAPNEYVFTATYIFHGMSFAFGYIGALTYIRAKIGNEFMSKLVMEFVLFLFIQNLAMTQLINLVLNIADGRALMLIYVIMNFALISIYYLKFMKKKQIVD